MKMAMSLRLLICILCALCVSAVNRSAFAADWSFSPWATLSQSYDSNFRFIAGAPPPGTTKGDFITSFSPVLSATGQTENTTFQFDTVNNAQSYILNPRFDIINTNTTASLTEAWSPIFSTSANFGFIHDSTLEDQLQASGIVTQLVERFAYSGGLGAQYALSESVNLVVSTLATDIIYPSKALPDSNSYQGTITPTWSITPLDNIGLSSSLSYTDYSKYTGNNNGTVIESLAESLFWQRNFTETLNLKLSAGYYFTIIDSTAEEVKFINTPPRLVLVNFPVSATDGGFIFGADLKKDWSEQFSTTFSAGEQQYNDANAQSFDSKFISGTASYKLTELTTFNFTARYNINDQLTQGTQTIDYYIISPSIERNLTENVILRLSGSYENESENSAGTNTVFDRYRTWVDLTYKWPRLLATH